MNTIHRPRLLLRHLSTLGRRLFSGALLLCITTGCQTSTFEQSAKASPASMVSPEYRVAPFDKIRLSVVRRSISGDTCKIESQDRLTISFAFGAGEYHLLPGDDIKVVFNDDPTLDFQTIVRPDGRITLPGLAEISAAGSTTTELSREINKSYVTKLSDPKSTVSVIKSNVSDINSLNGVFLVRSDGKISLPLLGEFGAEGLTPAGLAETLSASASSHFRNTLMAFISTREKSIASATEKEPEKLHELDKTLDVSSDGNLLLPDVGSVRVAGATLSELRTILKKTIQTQTANPVDISVSVEPSQHRAVFVSGEVKRPGTIPYTGGMTLLRAIAASGGITDEGDIARIVLIHYPAGGEVEVFKTNLGNVIKEGHPLADLKLSPQDVVFVPKTGIAKADLWVDQYINKLLPFSRSVNYTYSEFPGQTTF